jgi:hypothetical protein
MAIRGRAMRLTMLAAAAALAGAAIASACGSSSNSGVSQDSLDQLTARVQRDEMLNAWIAVSNLPVHDLDSTLQGGKIDGKYVPALRTLIRVLALTDFSSDIKPAAQKLHDDAVSLLQALNAGQDAATVAPLSAAVHTDSDKFNPALGDVVAKDLPADAGGPEPTKAASTSIAGTATPMPAVTP